MVKLSRSLGEGVLAGVELDGVGLQFLGQLDLPRIGIEEQADVDAAFSRWMASATAER